MDALDTLQAIRFVLNAYNADYGTDSAHSRLMEIDDIMEEWKD